MCRALGRSVGLMASERQCAVCSGEGRFLNSLALLRSTLLIPLRRTWIVGMMVLLNVLLTVRRFR